jgi:hypothetical protein
VQVAGRHVAATTAGEREQQEDNGRHHRASSLSR